MPQTTIYASPRSVGAPEHLPPAVTAHQLARLFGGSAALAGVSLSVEAGRCVALLGPNGAGKTTLLRILSTAIRPSYGTAAVDGIGVTEAPDLVRRRVAYLGHASGLYDDLTAHENLAFAAAMLGIAASSAIPRIADLLEQVGIGAHGGERVQGFSAGMRRRLALARILLARPSLVLLDEPFAALDEDGIRFVEGLLRSWRHTGVTTLVASHASERLSGLTDAAIHLADGLVVAAEGTGVTAVVDGPPTRERPDVDALPAGPLGAGA
jgi:heme exporter protein A